MASRAATWIDDLVDDIADLVEIWKPTLGKTEVERLITIALKEERAAVRELVQRVEDLNGDTYLYGIGEIEREALTHSRTEVSKAIARLKELMGEKP